MRKIPTLFERGDDGLVVPVVATALGGFDLWGATPTEKLDGANVRLTVRSGLLVRVEARKNPSKGVKHDFGIHDPWYREVMQVVPVRSGSSQPVDHHVVTAAFNTDVSRWPDGEHCCEAIGPKIQGNPLGLESPVCVPFDLQPPTINGIVPPPDLQNVRSWYDQLHEFLRVLTTSLGTRQFAEGIVWHGADGSRVKLKRKDFGL
jgi:hypothetical protein